MKAMLSNPNMRFTFALGASIGLGHALFRGLTENLGPIVGLLVFLPLIMLISGGLFLILGAFAKKDARHVAE